MGLLDAITGGIAGPEAPDMSSIANRSPINIAPVGVNLGAILQPYDQGSLENGGSGMTTISRYMGASSGSPSVNQVGQQPSIVPIVIAFAVFVGVSYFLFKR